MDDFEYETESEDVNFLTEFRQLEEARSAIEEKLSSCHPQWCVLYRSVVSKMNRKSLESGLVAYADLLGSHRDANRFQDFQDLRVAMLDLRQELLDIDKAAGIIGQQAQEAASNGYQESSRRTQEIQSDVRKRFEHSCSQILRKERELLEVFWEGNRPF